VASKSTFRADLEKEQRLSVLLDAYYAKHLRYYDFERISDLKSQLAGIDLILTKRSNNTAYFIDEKAQLDYINDDLPTFAFELGYQKNGKVKKGWLFDAKKKTDFYALITGIYCDEPNSYTSCKITLVNRKLLLSLLINKGLSETELNNILSEYDGSSGKVEIDPLNARTEGYLYFSNMYKAEKPINLILRFDFLLKNGVAKRLV
jgi:hypothetical protein